MMTLYQYEISPFCDKIRRILNVKRQPYRVQNITPSQSLTSLKKINPIGKVPCLEHEGRYLADSTDIAYYLEEKFPQPPLVPADPRERGLCHMIEDWADESLYFYEVRLRFTFPANQARTLAALTVNENALMKPLAPFIIPRVLRGKLAKQGVGLKPDAMVLRDVERHADAIDGWLAGRDWLAGAALSLADIAAFAQMSCIRDTAEGRPIVEKRPALAAWMDRVDRATAPAGPAVPASV